MFYLTTHSTHLSYGYMEERKEGNVYLTTHTTHFIYGYMASDIENGNWLPPHRLLFPISSKGSFICIIRQTG